MSPLCGGAGGEIGRAAFKLEWGSPDRWSSARLCVPIRWPPAAGAPIACHAHRRCTVSRPVHCPRRSGGAAEAHCRLRVHVAVPDAQHLHEHLGHGRVRRLHDRALQSVHGRPVGRTRCSGGCAPASPAAGPLARPSNASLRLWRVPRRWTGVRGLHLSDPRPFPQHPREPRSCVPQSLLQCSDCRHGLARQLVAW
eukprot:scaffold206_cov400-Prasinococcus_capsulatus_cf.AAC.4